ncbi:hypothetical protein CVT23_17405, partial [Minwuia thermotolerans]
ETVIESAGAVTLLENTAGAYVVEAGGVRTGITRDGGAVTGDSYAGWSMIHAEGLGGGGFQLLWQRTNGDYTMWETDGAGAYVKYYSVDPPWIMEAASGVDIDGDGIIGEPEKPETVIESAGAVTLLENTAGETTDSLEADEFRFDHNSGAATADFAAKPGQSLDYTMSYDTRIAEVDVNVEQLAEGNLAALSDDAAIALLGVSNMLGEELF